MKNVRSRAKTEFFRKIDKDRIIELQSEKTFIGIRKSHTDCDSYTFKQNEVLMDKTIYWGFAVLESSKVLLYETNYDELQPNFGEKNIQLHYMKTDSLVISIDTKDIIKDLRNLRFVWL